MKPSPTIERLILSIRNQRVILAGDLAMIYSVETRRLIEQVRRNAARFPGDFVFQLTRQEFEVLRSQNVISGDGRAALRSQNAILKRGQHINGAEQPKGADHERLRRACVCQHARATHGQCGDTQAAG